MRSRWTVDVSLVCFVTCCVFEGSHNDDDDHDHGVQEEEEAEEDDDVDFVDDLQK